MPKEIPKEFYYYELNTEQDKLKFSRLEQLRAKKIEANKNNFDTTVSMQQQRYDNNKSEKPKQDGETIKKRDTTKKEENREKIASENRNQKNPSQFQQSTFVPNYYGFPMPNNYHDNSSYRYNQQSLWDYWNYSVWYHYGNNLKQTCCECCCCCCCQF